MSGRKYTTIDSNELRNLRQDAAKLRGLRQDLPERIERAVQQTQQSIDRRLSPIEARQRKYEEAINGMSHEMREVEKRSAQRISENAKNQREALKKAAEINETERRKIRQDMHATAEEMRKANTATEKRLAKDLRETESRLISLNEKTRQAMHEQEKRLNAAIEQERSEREQGFQAINQRINSIEHNEQRLRALAEERINDAIIQRDFIANHYQHEHFLPGRLVELETALNSAHTVLQQGAPEAALGQANIVFQDLSILRIKLEQLDSEWRLWREQALQTAERILAEAQSNRTLNGIETKGEISEVDYWTQGKMTALEKDLERARKAAGDETYPMSIAEMRRMVEEILPELDGRLDKILEEAYIEIERSQLRVSVCDVVAEKLEAQGFTIVDHTYEGEDMRGGFYIKAQNRAGSEIVAAVSPDGDQERITIDSFDAQQRTPAELQDRLGTIAKEVEKHNLQVGTLTEESKSPSQENKDLEKVRKRETTRLKQQERAASTRRTIP